MKKLIFLVSGGGGNLKFFHLAAIRGIVNEFNLSVIADRRCGALVYAEQNGIPSVVVDYTRSEPEKLREVLEIMEPDLIITNWHKIIDADTIGRFPNRFVNLHYSLLPAFGGLIGVEPIRRAYQSGCKFIGPTCHFVDEGVDTGLIISQSVFSTERSIDESIALMFRAGCLVLLNGVYLVSNTNCSRPITDAVYVKSVFSPPLKFNANSFDENFWNEVSAL